jgi:hypothetical protein
MYLIDKIGIIQMFFKKTSIFGAWNYNTKNS